MASTRRQPAQEGGYVQRCVILHRDENGYGVTVSGENPVYVQSVKENSAANKAGVKVGDKIIKVNGTMVANSNHVEVVHLIKSGSYVALTLLGRSPGERASTHSPVPSERQRPLSLVNNISKIRTVESTEYKPDIEVEALQRNLDHERLFFQKTKEQYVLEPSLESQKVLADSQIRIRAIEDQLKALASGAPKSNSVRTVSRSTSDFHAARKPFQQHQRSHSVQGIKSSSSFKPVTAAPEASPTDLSNSSGDRTPSSSSEESLLKQISQTKIDYNSVPAQKQKAPKRTVSLRSFSRFYDRQAGPERQPTLVERPTISPPVPISPPTVHSETTDIVNVNHTRSKSDELNHTRTKSDVDDEPVSQAKKPYRPNNTEEAKMDSNSFVPGGKIENLQPVNSAMSVISMEEEEFDSADEKIDDHGPFLDLDTLKSKPAHLAVFLHFLMSNSDPSALFFWLVTETYAKEEGSLKDFRKWAYEIYSTFLAPSAPMKVCVPESIEQALAENLKSKSLSEEDFRNLFRSSRAFAFNEVSEQLADFRSKRALGLGSLFGDHQLEDDLDKDKELKIVEQTLLPHLEALTVEVEKNPKESVQYAAKNSAMASSLTTFMKHVGVSVKTGGSQINPLERHKSFAEKERSSLFKFKPSKKVVTVKGHQFIGTQYTECTLCNYCEGLLWGIGTQGMQCQVCEYNVHKGNCMESIEVSCTGIKRKLKIMEKPKIHKPVISRKPGIQKGEKTGKVEGTDDTDSESLSLPNSHNEMRSRGNSLNEDPDKQSSQQSEEQTLSDQEAEKSSSKSPGPYEESLHEPITRERESKKSKGDYPTKKNNLTHAQSVKMTREFVRLLDRKKTITSVSTEKIGQKGDGLNMDNGVYVAQPYNRKPDSPPMSDEEEEQDEELELDDVPSLPWSQMVDKKIIKKLKDKEVKRQEVIHELINTEKTHVRHLKVLEKVFLKPMQERQIMPPEVIQQIFPNLAELIEIHTSLLADMNTRCAQQGDVITSVADIILARFDGAPGEKAKEVAALFNHNQRMAMEMLKNRTKKDSKLAAFMARQEESKYCRRLKFNDIMANTHQRLTKYPLLLREMLKSTPSSNPELKELEKCARCCKDILNHVNKSMKETENKWRLIELSKKIDMKALEGNTKIFDEFKDFDLTKHKLVHEGDLIWRINRTKTIELHVLLLDLYMILLQKQDDKLLLKSHSTTLSTGLQDMKTTHSPIIKLQNLLTRDVATDKRAFFLVSTSSVGPQIYELVTSTILDRNTWVKVITECVDASLRKGKERGRRGALCIPPSGSVALSESIDEKEETPPHGSSSRRGSAVSKDENGNKETEKVEEKQKEADEVVYEELQTPEVVEEKPVKKIDPPSKERIAELYEQLRIKDDEVKKLLEDKAKIVAELRCQEFGPTITAETTTNDSQAEAREFIFAAILQGSRLAAAVNEIFNVHQRSESNGLIDMRAMSPNPASIPNGISREESQNDEDRVIQSPQEVLIEATTTINEQLTSLLRIITDDENTKERLQSDLQESQAAIKRLTQTANSDVTSESGESPDIVPSSSLPSLSSLTTNASTMTPDIMVSDDISEEDSNRSEVFDEIKSVDENSHTSPVTSVSSDDPILLLGHEVSRLEGFEV
ncbi:rho guanine nucleotide exchange factor 11-like isoform X2 [Rhopilema esculentum]|uniref:rho guanine nucleotide exchange factor 11-like isoform X2 n=1 Tax=Rhopilema esculentum TaxID=499914 RepID=UPI0031DD2ECB